MNPEIKARLEQARDRLGEELAWKRVGAIAYDLYFHMSGSMDSKLYKYGIELETLASEALSRFKKGGVG